MPNLIGMTLNDATNLIISLGGQVTGVVYEDVKYPLLRQERGIVLAQWPLPGTPVTAFAVFLVVSSGFVNYPDIGDSINQQVNTVIGSIH
jgi:beta-lactam-binding protein with PASTA domain